MIQKTLEIKVDLIESQYSNVFQITEKGPRYTGLKGKHYVGVKTVVHNHRKEDAWRDTIKTGFEAMEPFLPLNSTKRDVPNPTEKINKIHDTVLWSIHKAASILEMLNKHKIKVIKWDEFPVGDPEIKVKQSPKSDLEVGVIGSIDLLCKDENENLIICDLKTITQVYHDITLQDLILKVDHARQMEMYALLLEKMGSLHDIQIEVKYFVLIGYDSNYGSKGRIGLWKIDRNPKKYIETVGLEDRFDKIKISS